MEFSKISVDNSFFNDSDSVVFSAKGGHARAKSAASYDVARANVHNYGAGEAVKSGEGVVRFFADDEQVGMSLSKGAMDALRGYFDESDFVTLEDGSVGLSGDANAYVEGWFKDIAYSRGYLGADEDGDGLIVRDELMNARGFAYQTFSASVNAEGELGLSNAKAGESYVKGSDVASFANPNLFRTTTIEAILDRTIRSDKDMNGQITWLEGQSGGGSLGNAAVNDVMGAAQAVVSHLENGNQPWVKSETHVSVTVAKYGLEMSSKSSVERVKADLDALKKTSLLARYPEFRAFIENNENVNESRLAKMRSDARSAIKGATGLSDDFIERNFFKGGALDMAGVRRYDEFNLKFSMEVMKIDITI